MGTLIKKLIPEKTKEENPKPIPIVVEKPLPMPTPDQPVLLDSPTIEQVSATDGPSTTEVEMSSGMDGITDSLNKKKKGRKKTILTGSQGLTDDANTVAPTLIG